MLFENILEKIGHFGYGQRIIVFKLYLCACIHIIFMYSSIIHMAVPDHRCQQRGAEVSELKCFQYSNKTDTCDKWVYDQSEFTSTIAAEMNMICDKAYQKSIIQMSIQVGRMISGIFILPLADRYGRKSLINIFLFIGISAHFAVTFCRTFTLLCMLSVILGVVCVPVAGGSFTIGVELCGTRRRLLIATLHHFGWPTTIAMEAIVSYFIRDSRSFQVAILIPIVLWLPLVLTIPESPRWLILRGRVEEAEEILNWIAKKNGVKVNLTDIYVGKIRNTESFVDLLQSKKLVVRALLASLIFFCNNMAYCATYLESANMFGNVRLSMISGSVFETVTLAATYLPLLRFEKKWIVFIGMFFGGISCCLYPLTFVTPIIPHHVMFLVIIVFMKCFYTLSATALWIYLPELFPTSCRTGTIGQISFVGYIGSCMTPYICNLNLFSSDPVNKAVSLSLLGASTIISALFSLLLPETKNKRLAETISEAEQLFLTKDENIEE